MVHGNYGQFQVLDDNVVLVDGGKLALAGVLPSVRKVVEAVRARLAGLGPVGGKAMSARAAFVAAAVLVFGCAEMGGLMSLPQQLVREFASPLVNVNLSTNGNLTVIFQNSPLGELDSASEAKVARQVAAFVRDHYAGYGKLQTVSVGFGTRRGAGPVTVTNTRIPHSFRTTDLGPPVRPDSVADSTRKPAT